MKEGSLASRVAMAGACIVCCSVPMLVVFGAISVASAAVGSGALVAGLVVVGAWAVWRHRAGAGAAGAADGATATAVPDEATSTH